MRNFFFTSYNFSQEWCLKPIKYSKDSPNNFSSKISLPMSILNDLTIQNLPLPYIFEISHENGILKTKCTVGNFTDYEGQVMLPAWMWEHLDLQTSSFVQISYIRLPLGKKVKLLPHSTDFLKIDNPRVELETALRNYGVLTIGDEIRLNFIHFKNMIFSVIEVDPSYDNSIYIVDTDLNVEFEEPLGYQEELKENRTVLKHCNIGESNEKYTSFQQNGLTLFLGFDSFK